MKRLCLGCVDELLAVFLKFPEVDYLIRQMVATRILDSQNVLGRRGEGVGRQYRTIKDNYIAYE